MTTPKTTGPTPPRQFRLSDETIATIDALAAKLGLAGRAEVIRFAITRLAAAELEARSTGRPPPPALEAAVLAVLRTRLAEVRQG